MTAPLIFEWNLHKKPSRTTIWRAQCWPSQRSIQRWAAICESSNCSSTFAPKRIDVDLSSFPVAFSNPDRTKESQRLALNHIGVDRWGLEFCHLHIFAQKYN